jgi:hypothetical protein
METMQSHLLSHHGSDSAPLQVFSIVIDWRSPQPNDSSYFSLARASSSSLAELSAADTRHGPLLKLNGYALLGCHLLSWVQQSTKIQQNASPAAAEESLALPSAETTVMNPPQSDIESLSEELSEASKEERSNPQQELTNDPILEFVWQLLEDLGRIFREHVLLVTSSLPSSVSSSPLSLSLMNSSLIQQLLPLLLPFFFGPSKTIWVDMSLTIPAQPHLSSLFIDNLNRFMIPHGSCQLKELTESSCVQEDDHIILLLSPYATIPCDHELLRQRSQRYCEIGCNLLILCDGYLKSTEGIQRIIEEHPPHTSSSSSAFDSSASACPPVADNSGPPPRTGDGKQPLVLCTQLLVDGMFAFIRQEIQRVVETSEIGESIQDKDEILWTVRLRYWLLSPNSLSHSAGVC